MTESKRIKRFKDSLINELPFYPHDRNTRLILEENGLNGILIHYLHWKSRLIPSRKRKIRISPELTSDKRWKLLKEKINIILELAAKGKDLTPYLSKKAHKNGYTPKYKGKDPWEDKDLLLNTKGLHHFHLGSNDHQSEISERTNHIILAHVTRREFFALGIFDHSVFDPIDENGSLSIERDRMWTLHKKYTEIGMKPGTLYISNLIATSGHPTHIVSMADFYSSIIRNTDMSLNDRIFVNGLYDQGNLTHPNKFEFDWKIEGLDLCAYDKKTKTMFILHEGPM